MAMILILRPAEKPDGANNCVTEQGASDPQSLLPRGWQRAGWAAFFGSPGGRLKPDLNLGLGGREGGNCVLREGRHRSGGTRQFRRSLPSSWDRTPEFPSRGIPPLR